ncbi:MAG: AbrB/MazE/SpoVT family DNA-binding domain-containing protein [Ruminococcaceae bacterium]|nr:AbrB/MazE/SpoVT family DNA-binding domain-containing protein [Oscillospiraceae bacterium]MBR3595691.1 AbrB/MazE/SpoVT family DNA-binding domain-containing protein [Clostridia bacterium]
MKATGIVRRIDDLGRVVIPKEIRRTMRIREGDPLEIYTDAEGEVIFKKYSPMGELAEFTSQYCEVLFKAISMPVLITDRDHVVCSMGVTKKDAVDKRITSQLEKIMENRASYIATSFENNILTPVEGLDKNACIAVPIIGNGDVSGCVVVLFNDKGELPTNAETKLAEVAASFLGKQTEE